MKPKFEQNLGQLIKYLYSKFNDYQVEIYIDGNLKFNRTMQVVEFFGNDYLKVTEYTIQDKSKTIYIYTNM